jgi:hypothetical protein
MQDAGWTYEFFDGSLLLRQDVAMRDRLVQPDGPGYQALLVYQSSLDADVARLLLEWARAGLPILFVHGASELRLLTERSYTRHERAAAHTPGLDGRDDELARLVAEILSLPTVAEVDDPADTVGALRDLGIAGRAEFRSEVTSVLTHLRDDDDLAHLYAYHFLYETGADIDVEFTLDGTGPVYRIDPWGGQLVPYADTRREGARTVIRARLSPGEIALFTLDRSGDTVAIQERTEHLADLHDWSITVESWDAGDTELVTEDRGLGYETREVRPHTAVTRLAAAETGSSLLSWRDIPEIGPEVSGVGEYVTTFELDREPLPAERIVLDLGSTAGGLGAVQINDAAQRGFDTSRPRVDITADVHAGHNQVAVRVASSLNNRLIARGYYADLPDIVGTLLTGTPATQQTTIRDHGLLGPVRVERITHT